MIEGSSKEYPSVKRTISIGREATVTTVRCRTKSSTNLAVDSRRRVDHVAWQGPRRVVLFLQRKWALQSSTDVKNPSLHFLNSLIGQESNEEWIFHTDRPAKDIPLSLRPTLESPMEILSCIFGPRLYPIVHDSLSMPWTERDHTHLNDLWSFPGYCKSISNYRTLLTESSKTRSARLPMSNLSRSKLNLVDPELSRTNIASRQYLRSDGFFSFQELLWEYPFCSKKH